LVKFRKLIFYQKLSNPYFKEVSLSEIVYLHSFVTLATKLNRYRVTWRSTDCLENYIPRHTYMWLSFFLTLVGCLLGRAVTAALVNNDCLNIKPLTIITWHLLNFWINFIKKWFSFSSFYSWTNLTTIQKFISIILKKPNNCSTLFNLNSTDCIIHINQLNNIISINKLLYLIIFIYLFIITFE